MGGDCDDDDATITTEDVATYYRDADGDGYGIAEDAITACREASGYVSVSGDCDDDDALISPDAEEICDGADNDCDDSTDEGLSLIHI